MDVIEELKSFWENSQSGCEQLIEVKKKNLGWGGGGGRWGGGGRGRG